MDNKFKFIVPAELEKSQDGSWKVRGLASTGTLDQQGETIIQKGIDLTPIDAKRGVLNWDHGRGPENTIGLLDGYKKAPTGLYIEGRLFKNHSKAKAVREIMESLGEGDRGRMGLSVEGKIIERDPNNPKIIKKCQISAVALTMNPVNTDTFADIVKSMNESESIEFDAKQDNSSEEFSEEPTFTASQVMAIVQKALGVGAGYTQAPADMSGGDALAQESLDKDEPKKKKKKMKKMEKSLYKSNLIKVLDQLQVLYPHYTRSEIWEAVKERLDTKFPDIGDSFGKAGIRLKNSSASEREHKLFEEARQRSDYEENKGKSPAQLHEIAEQSGGEKREKQKIRAAAAAARQVGEKDYVRPHVKS